MKTQFDKIYVLSLITNKDRQEFITYQFNQLGLDFEFIYGIDIDNFENIHWPDLFDNPKDRPKDLSCTLTHYQAVMQAYHLGYNNVLIFEDDVCLNKDMSLFEDMLNNIPNDADFVTYDYRNSENYENEIIKKIKETKNKYIKIEYDNSFYGGAMFGIMNRKTMELYLNSQHDDIHMSDNVINIFHTSYIKEQMCNRYTSTKCLFVDQLTYNKIFINNDYSLHEYYDNMFLRMEENERIKKYNKDIFFKPENFHRYSREEFNF